MLDPEDERGRFERSPRQFLNEFLALHAMERREAIAFHRPLEVHLQLTSTCNLDCFMCSEHVKPADERARPRYLSPALFGKIRDELLPFSSRVEFGVGGEPMLSPHFREYLEHAFFLRQEASLLTNGTRITTDAAAKLLVRCVSRIHVSIDGATAATYERIRAGGRFDRLLENIGRLNRFRLAEPPGKRLHLTIGMVLMRSNVHELPAYVDLAKRLHADCVTAWHVIPVTPEGASESLLCDPAAVAGAAREASERARALGIESDLPDVLPAGEPPAGDRTARAGRARTHCHLPSIAVYVLWDGRVFPCAHPFAHQGEPLGSLAEQSFDEIWNGRSFRNLRAGLARRDAPLLCRRCPIVKPPEPALLETSVLTAAAAGLVGHFGDRDLAPLRGAPPGRALLDEAESVGLASALRRRMTEHREMSRHIETVERESAEMKAHIAAIERESAEMKAHIANLETAIESIRSEKAYRIAAQARRAYRFVFPR